MSRTSIGLVLGLLGLTFLACGGGRTGLGIASSGARSSSQEPTSPDEDPGAKPGTGSPRSPSQDGTCPASSVPCGTGKAVRCVTPESDPMNCGACGHACSSGIACVAGTCQQTKCTGALSFQKIASYPPKHPPRYPTAPFYGWYVDADLNGDGHLDLIERVDNGQDDKTGETIIWLGQSDGTFVASASFPIEGQVGYAGFKEFDPGQDFTGDGLPDLVAPNADHTRILIRPGLPGGGWGTATDSVSGSPLIGLLAIGDLDGDGNLDLIAERFSDSKKGLVPPPQIVELRGHGDGTFAGARPLGFDYQGPLTLLDWNGDGLLDILLDGTFLHIVYGKGGGTFAEDQPCAVGGDFGSTVFVDLNRDGRFDMLWIPPSSKRLATAFGRGGCSFTARTDYTFSFELVGFSLGDLDGDGVTDLLVGGRTIDPRSVPLNDRYLMTTAFLAGRADGTFVRQPDLEIAWPVGGTGIITDVNGDGRSDIVTTGNAGIEVYANTCPGGGP